MAAPRGRMKLPLPSHVSPHPGPHPSIPQMAAAMASCPGLVLSLWATSNDLSLLSHCSSRLPVLGLSLQPYCSASVPTTSCLEGHLLFQIFAKKPNHMGTEKISNGVMPRPYMCKSYNTEEHVVRGWCPSPLPAGTVLLCRCGN